MNTRRRNLAICGFTQDERDVLMNLCRISETRSIHYQLTADHKAAHGVMVDLTHPEALTVLSAQDWPCTVGFDYHPDPKTDAQLKQLCVRRLTRPLRWAGMLVALDEQFNQLAESENQRIINAIRPWFDPELTLKFATQPAVLVASRDPRLLQVLHDTVGRTGFRVDHAEDLDGALDRIEVNRYNIAFVDRNLGQDASNIVIRATTQKTDRRRTATILVSDKLGLSERLTTLMYQCDAHLTRPINARQAIDIITRFLPKWQPAQTATTAGTTVDSTT